MTNDYCFKRIGPKPGHWHVRGFKLQTAGSGSGLFAQDGATIHFQNINFGACASYAIGAHRRGLVAATGNFEISGSSPCWLVSSANSLVDVAGAVVTLTGSPTWSSQGVFVARNSAVEIHSMTFAGSANGPRYLADTNGVIFTAFGGASYLPGNSAGSASNGGVYI